MKLDDILAIEKRREEGGWMTAANSDMPNLPLKVRSVNSEIVQKKIADIYAKATPAEREKPGFQVSVDKQTILDAILVDWKMDDFEFNRENVERMVELTSFREAVNICCSRVGREGRDTLDADAKN